MSGEDRVSVELREVMEESQRLGFLGPSDLDMMLTHARGFAHVSEAPPQRMLDLGSGGGLPGLVLAEAWPGTQVVLLDSQKKRVDFLRLAVRKLDLAGRVRVVAERAESVGRWQEFRGQFDTVVARGFGRPSATVECAAPFLRVGGRLIVSEPPTGEGRGGDLESGRWSDEGLARLGLVRGRRWREPYGYQELVQQTSCPEGFPRRAGLPVKRPLF